MGAFTERWWLRYLRWPESPVLPLICSPHPSPRSRLSRPDFEADISTAMAKAREVVAQPSGSVPGLSGGGS
jgi:hypothetical protein